MHVIVEKYIYNKDLGIAIKMTTSSHCSGIHSLGMVY